MNDYILSISDFKPAFAMGGGATQIEFPRGPSTHVVECWVLPGYFIMRYQHQGVVRTEPVLLTYIKPNFGGRRWYFICPRCERRCTKIHRPIDRERYLCRRCHQRKRTMRPDEYAPLPSGTRWGETTEISIFARTEWGDSIHFETVLPSRGRDVTCRPMLKGFNSEE